MNATETPVNINASGADVPVAAIASLEEYRVNLDAYSGPLDLLLFLVRRHEIDLADIPIAKLTAQYLTHLKLLRQIDVNLCGEFLVMAATLLEIKSAMLVPNAEAEETTVGSATTENPLDPRYELVQQLLAYKRFKDAATALDKGREEWESRYAHRPASIKPVERMSLEQEYVEPTEPIEIDLEDVHILDLCEAFARILESIGANSQHKVTYDDTPISLHADDIIDRLQRDAKDGSMTLKQIFEGRTGRSELIGLFLAVLELVRQKRIRVVQETPESDIEIRLRPASDQTGTEEDKSVDWRDPKTGEMQYEWPSEQAKKAAERRAKLRASYAAKRAAGEAGAEGEAAQEEPEMQDDTVVEAE